MQNLLNLLNVSGLGISGFVMVSNLIFEAILTNSLTLTVGTEPSTFTRTSTATVKDFEGLIKNVLTGESRFEGARRVENLLSYSKDFTHVDWVKFNGSGVVANSIIDPNGEMTGTKLTLSTASESGLYQFARPIQVTGDYISSIWMKADSNISVRLGIQQFPDNTDEDVNLTTEWKRFSVAKSLSAENSFLTIRKTAADIGTTKVLYIFQAQTEEVTGQAITTIPSEYISTNSLVNPGVELITNGTFDTDISGWSDGQNTPTTTWIGGQIDVFGDLVNESSQQAISMEIGKRYFISVDHIDNSSGGGWAIMSSAATAWSTDRVDITPNGATYGTSTIVFTATHTTHYLHLLNSFISTSARFDNVTVKEITYPANVDGVQYFPYVNGNTVTSNEITEAIGTPISQSTMKGIMIERTKTNYMPYSEDATNASWSKNGTTIVTGQKYANVNLDKVSETATNNVHYFNDFTTLTNYVCASCFVKKGTRRYVGIQVTTVNTAVRQAVLFDLDTGLFERLLTPQGTPANIKYGIEAFADGVYRIWVKIDNVSNFSYCIPFLSDSANPTILSGSPQYLGDVNEYGYFGGVQLEDSPTVTSYILTEGGTVTRATEGLSYLTTDNIVDNDGTIFVDYTVGDNTQDAWILRSFIDNQNQTYILRTGASIRFDKSVAGVVYSAIISPAWNIGQTYRIGVRYSSSTGMTIFVDGVQGTTDANTLPLQLGATIGPHGGAENNFNMKNFKAYDKTYTDVEMVTFTT